MTRKNIYFFSFFFFIFLFISIYIVFKFKYSIKDSQIDTYSKENELENYQYIDKELILEKAYQGKDFLLKMEENNENGFYKYYLPFESNNFENRLHTTYSATIIYGFLFFNELEENKEILNKLSDWGEFLLRMQNKDKEDSRYGAFVYSYFFNQKNKEWGSKIEEMTIDSKGKKIKDYFYIDDKGRELNYVVGTNSKTIFTLLRLYEYTKDNRYLDSAKIAGEWLLTMQREDGRVKSYVIYRNGKWFFGTKESLLYQGQVLSAFSRLYKITKEEKYYKAGKKIADRFVDKIKEADGKFVTDDYRSKNAISNSWIVMSLMDFYNISLDDNYKKIIFEHSEKIIEDQIVDKNNFNDFGRYKSAFSTSGTGWIAEVLTEVYRFCLNNKEKNCDIYKDSVVRAIMWVINNTYSEKEIKTEKSEDLIGGIYWNKNYKHIRSDSIAHSLNAYTRIIEYLKEGDLINSSTH